KGKPFRRRAFFFPAASGRAVFPGKGNRWGKKYIFAPGKPFLFSVLSIAFEGRVWYDTGVDL
ncbi:MAG: hypothetical protein IKX85_02385, partial [Clostridia bacterium]|nr:hypothetical protein [Clostridia bacterium]